MKCAEGLLTLVIAKPSKLASLSTTNNNGPSNIATSIASTITPSTVNAIAMTNIESSSIMSDQHKVIGKFFISLFQIENTKFFEF